MIPADTQVFGIDFQRIISLSPILFGVLLLLFLFIWLSRRRDSK